MNAVEEAQDVAGTQIIKGDTVATVNGQTTGKVCDLAREDNLDFVCLRPAHQSYGKGMWYSADQVYWVARPGSASKKKTDAKSPRSEPARKK